MTKHGAAPPMTAAVARCARAAWFFGNVAAWFFGNVYEGVVAVPQLIARANRPAAILATGSPVCYFAPVAPAAVGGTATVLTQSWRNGADRRAIAAATATLGAAVGLSAYLIGSINVPLLRAKVAKQDQPRLISRWHRGNTLRRGLLAVTDPRLLGRSKCRCRLCAARALHNRQAGCGC
jgi:hypothetical protein